MGWGPPASSSSETASSIKAKLEGAADVNKLDYNALRVAAGILPAQLSIYPITVSDYLLQKRHADLTPNGGCTKYALTSAGNPIGMYYYAADADAGGIVADATVIQGTWAIADWSVPPTSPKDRGFVNNASGAIGDEIDFTRKLDAGIYTFKHRQWQGSGEGTTIVKLDDTVIDTFDYYITPGENPNITRTITGIVVTTGNHTLKFIAAAGGGSSQKIFLQEFILEKTS